MFEILLRKTLGLWGRLIFSYKYVLSVPMRVVGRFKSIQIQLSEFKKLNYTNYTSMVVFFIPVTQKVAGGTLQMFTLNRLTREIYKNTDTTSLLCWLPGKGKHFYRFEGFNNNETVFSIEMLLKNCAPNCKLLFHVPEYTVEHFFNYFGNERLKRLRSENRLRINILNQNIDSMISPNYIKKLKEQFPDITITAGNPAWVSDFEKSRMNCPIYPLPTWYYPDDAPWQPYESKNNLLIVSPDRVPNKDKILNTIRKSLPNLQIKIIQKMKYEEYLSYERSAKWSLTFGEGLDGYFYGPVLRGGIAFAVRNGTFNLPGLTCLKTVYDDYEAMAEGIVADIQDLDTKEKYEKYNKLVRVPLTRVIGKEKTSAALTAFYDEIKL